MKKTINTMEELLKTLGLEDENHINWFDVSRNRKLSENFIEKYIDKLDFAKIIKYQNVSDEFIMKHINAQDIRKLCADA